MTTGATAPQQDFAVGRSRIAVATADTLKPQMAGPAIRAWEIAAALAVDHEVRLVGGGTRRLRAGRAAPRSCRSASPA